MARLPGATTTYLLKEDKTVVVKQGTDDTEPVMVLWGNSRSPLRDVRYLLTTADNDVFAVTELGAYYEIGRDDIARPTGKEEYERRRDEAIPSRGYRGF